MSRPTATQRAQVQAQQMKAHTTYAEIAMAVDVLDGVASREYARFGPGSEIAGQLVRVGVLLEQVRRDAEARAREQGTIR